MKECKIVDYEMHKIPDYAFTNKKSLVYFSFPETLTKIGSYAFNGTMLSGSLIIPDDVVIIDSWAFGQTNITSLQLPHKLKEIGGGAFYQCANLAGTLSLPES